VARYQDGRTITISKKPGEWNKNFPSWFEMAPGARMVINVDLGPLAWQNLPPSDKSGEVKIRLKAVYEIPEDRESKKHGIWTGRVASEEKVYSLYWTVWPAKNRAVGSPKGRHR
jgi:hypothetical protein